MQGDQVRLVAVRSGWVVVADAHRAATMVVERETWFPAEPPPDAAVSGAAATALPGTAKPATTRPGAASMAPSGSRPPAASSHPAEVVATAQPLSAAPDRAAPPAAAKPAAGPAAQATAAEQAFHDGLRALLAGHARDATDPLDRACGVPSTSQDDICYWAAIAWLRAGDRAQARRALTDVLARYPSSTHAGEASVALGWLLLDAGDRVAARPRFAAAASDRMPGVRAEAARGLAAAQ